MKNYVQKGETLTIPAPEDIVSGQIVAVGGLIGVAAGDAANGENFDLVTEGVFALPKVSTDAVTIGATLYFDASAGVVTTDADSGANSRIGLAVTAAGNPSASVNVKLG